METRDINRPENALDYGMGPTELPETNEFERLHEKGTVGKFFPQDGKQFGFLRTSQGDVFFHINDGREITSLLTGSVSWGENSARRLPKEGDEVLFERTVDKNGRSSAGRWGYRDECEYSTNEMAKNIKKYPRGLYYDANENLYIDFPHRLGISEVAGQKPVDNVTPNYGLLSEMPILKGREEFIERIRTRVEGFQNLLIAHKAFLSECPIFQGASQGQSAVVRYRGRDLKFDKRHLGYLEGVEKYETKDGSYYSYPSETPIGGVASEEIKSDKALEFLIRNHCNYDLSLGSQRDIDGVLEKAQISKRDVLVSLVQEQVLHSYLTQESFKKRIGEIREEIVAEMSRAIAVRGSSEYSINEQLFLFDETSQEVLSFLGWNQARMGSINQVRGLGSNHKEIHKLIFRAFSPQKGFTPPKDLKSWSSLVAPYRKETIMGAGLGDVYEEWRKVLTPGGSLENTPELANFLEVSALVREKLGSEEIESPVLTNRGGLEYGFTSAERDLLVEKWREAKKIYENEYGYDPITQHPGFYRAEEIVREIRLVLEFREIVSDVELQERLETVMKEMDFWVVKLESGNFKATSALGAGSHGDKLGEFIRIEKQGDNYTAFVLSKKGVATHQFDMPNQGLVVLGPKGVPAVKVSRVGMSYIALSELNERPLDRAEILDPALQSKIERMIKGSFGYQDTILIALNNGSITTITRPEQNDLVLLEGGRWKRLDISSVGGTGSVVSLSGNGNPLQKYSLPHEGLVLVDGKGTSVVVVRERRDGEGSSSYVALKEILPGTPQGLEERVTSSIKDPNEKNSAHNPFADFFNKKL